MTTTSGAQSLVALLRNTNATTLRNVLLQWSLQDVADALVSRQLVRCSSASFELPSATMETWIQMASQRTALCARRGPSRPTC